MFGDFVFIGILIEGELSLCKKGDAFQTAAASFFRDASHTNASPIKRIEGVLEILNKQSPASFVLMEVSLYNILGKVNSSSINCWGIVLIDSLRCGI